MANGTKVKIDISLVIGALEACRAFTKNEFSGFGFGKWDETGTTFKVYRVDVLDVGTYGWTEIAPAKIKPYLTDPDLANMRLWLHRHPMGHAEPGPDNWSGTDHNTCRNEPLGAAYPPTRGWTGCVDEYGPGKGTTYCDVVPNPYHDLLPGLRELEKFGSRYKGLSEAGLERRPSPTMTEYEWKNNRQQEFAWASEVEEDWDILEAIQEQFQSEGDDGPMHMFIQDFMENR